MSVTYVDMHNLKDWTGLDLTGMEWTELNRTSKTHFIMFVFIERSALSKELQIIIKFTILPNRNSKYMYVLRIHVFSKSH